MILEILDENDFSGRRLLKDGLWLVEMGAERCAPCKAIKPLLAALPAQFPSLRAAELDADEHYVVADRFAVRSLPTLLLFKDGEVIDQRVGGLTKTAIQVWLSSAVT